MFIDLRLTICCSYAKQMEEKKNKKYKDVYYILAENNYQGSLIEITIKQDQSNLLLIQQTVKQKLYIILYDGNNNRRNCIKQTIRNCKNFIWNEIIKWGN